MIRKRFPTQLIQPEQPAQPVLADAVVKPLELPLELFILPVTKAPIIKKIEKNTDKTNIFIIVMTILNLFYSIFLHYHIVGK